MSRKCATCTHPDVRDINAQIVEGGGSNRDLARKYCLSEDSLARHKANHLPKREVQEAVEEREFGHHKKLRILEKVLFSVLARRLKDQDDSLVLKTHASLLRHYSFELQLSEVEEIKAEIAALTEMVRDREEHR